MSEQFTFHIQELIAAAVFILGGGGVGTVLAKQKGWITFGRPTERRHCPDAIRNMCGSHDAMLVEICNITADVVELKKAQQDNIRLLRDVSSQVERLVGYQEGQRNGANRVEG